MTFEPDDPIREWMLERIDEAAARRDWSKLPADFESDAVKFVFAHVIKRHFNSRHIRQRIRASKAKTFADLRAAITT